LSCHWEVSDELLPCRNGTTASAQLVAQCKWRCRLGHTSGTPAEVPIVHCSIFGSLDRCERGGPDCHAPAPNAGDCLCRFRGFDACAMDGCVSSSRKNGMSPSAPLIHTLHISPAISTYKISLNPFCARQSGVWLTTTEEQSSSRRELTGSSKRPGNGTQQAFGKPNAAEYPGNRILRIAPQSSYIGRHIGSGREAWR